MCWKASRRLRYNRCLSCCCASCCWAGETSRAGLSIQLSTRCLVALLLLLEAVVGRCCGCRGTPWLLGDLVR